MLLKLKNRAIEINTIGKPNDNLWNALWEVRLARIFFTNKKYTFYIMLWENKSLK